MTLIIVCFVIAVFIYFSFYYEKDKKRMSQRSKIKRTDTKEEYFIFPLFEDSQDDAGSDFSGVPEENIDIYEE